MEILTTKQIQVKEAVNLLRNIKVNMTNSRDVDSTNFEIHYNETQIGHGHLNNKTNFAHVTINEGLFSEEDECELIDYLVDGIEGGTINT